MLILFDEPYPFLTHKFCFDFKYRYFFVLFFESVHPLYALGHFNYLHDVKCPTPPSLKTNKERSSMLSMAKNGRAHTLRGVTRGSKIGKDMQKLFELDVSPHQNYNVSFEDFMISLIPGAFSCLYQIFFVLSIVVHEHLFFLHTRLFF